MVRPFVVSRLINFYTIYFKIGLFLPYIPTNLFYQNLIEIIAPFSLIYKAKVATKLIKNKKFIK